MRIPLQVNLVLIAALFFTGCELGKEERDRLNGELAELREQREGAIFACRLVHQNEYQTWREDNADGLPTDDYAARAMCFEKEKDQGWVKAWKATEEQISELDLRIKEIEMLLGVPEKTE